MTLSTLLDLLGALLLIVGVTLGVSTIAPLWVTVISAGVLLLIFSWVIDRPRKGADK